MPKKITVEARRKLRAAELRATLLLLARRTTSEGTLTALANKVSINNENFSRYIHKGEVPLRRAAELLRLKGANPKYPTVEDEDRVITLKDLSPSAF